MFSGKNATHFTRWVSSRTNLDMIAKRKFSPPIRNRIMVVQPVVTYSSIKTQLSCLNLLCFTQIRCVLFGLRYYFGKCE